MWHALGWSWLGFVYPILVYEFKKTRFFFLTLLVVFFPSTPARAQNSQPWAPLPPRAEPLADLLPQRGHLRPGQRLLTLNSQYFKKEHRINLETRQVEIVETLNLPGASPFTFGQSFYPELSQYSLEMAELSLQNAWLSRLIGQNDARSGGGVKDNLSWELPYKVPVWLKRLGADKPKLQMNGSFKVILEGGATRGFPGKKNSFVPSFNLDNEPTFSVTGSIGRLIHVEINSEQAFGTSFRDQLKISYRGEGDELEDNIIQEISLGNIALELPGTQLTGYSEQHKGIFGVKTRLKFGDLHVTSILSQEGGAHETQTLDNSRESEQEMLTKDNNPVLYKHFFLTLRDRADYADPRPNYGVGSANYRLGGRNRGQLEIWTLVNMSRSQPKTEQKIRTAFAFDSTGQKIPDLFEKGIWVKMPTDSNRYSYNENLRMLTVPGGGESQALAARWRFNTAQGDPSLASDDELVLIKPSYAPQDPRLDKLMWRHVYFIGKVDDEFKHRFRLHIQDAQKNQSQGNRSFRTLLGLTAPSSPNELDLSNKDIFDFVNGILILPCRTLDSAKNSDASQCLTPLKRLNPQTQIYDLPSDQLRERSSSTHEFVFLTRQKQSVFDVTQPTHGVAGTGGCLDITPGTEKLILNGSTELRRGIDYEVLYEVGQITLTSPMARDPNAQIKMSYECTPAFQIQDKWLAGTRLQYNLDALSDESLLGATFLFKSQTSREKRPQLEREPFHQFLWGINSTLSGNPRWMTSVVNLVPFISTQAESRVKWDFELAQSYYNPNTKGTALVDDFENSKRDYSFPVHISNWKQASPPGGLGHEAWYDPSLDYRHAGAFIWHSNRVERFGAIYGESQFVRVNTQEVRLLSFKLTPNDNLRGNSWGGVMRGLTSGSRNQSRKRFLEIVARGSDANLGIDLGKISEDLSIAGERPNDSLNSEVEFGSYINQDDPGLDGKTDSSETGRVWECKPSCISQLVRGTEDPAQDGIHGEKNWVEPKDGDTDPSPRINATEGNNSRTGGFAYDTEDLNFNNVLDVTNQFARYQIDFRQVCGPLTYCEELVNGWRKYRIPLYEESQYTLIGAEGKTISDILAQVEYTRLWFGRLSPGVAQSELYLARVSIVGNDWEESPRNKDYEVTAPALITSDSILIQPQTTQPDNNNLRVLVINNREEKNNYNSSPNTVVERDTETDEPVQEQSLLMRYENLHPGEQVYATRLLPGQDRDFTDYNRLKLEMRPIYTGEANQNKLNFILQFGRDDGNEKSSNYYEISLPLLENINPAQITDKEIWQKHAIDVNLNELTQLKDSSWLYTKKNSRTLFNRARQDSSLRISVVGDPSMAQINWMRLSLAVDPNAPERQSGEIWVNDLRLEGVNKTWGTAIRTSFQSSFSDFIVLSASSALTHGDFTSFTQERKTPAQSLSTLDYNTALTINTNKFLPDEWGVQTPLSLNYQAHIDRPFVKPSSDIRLRGNDLSDIGTDLFSGNLVTRDTLSDQAELNSRVYQFYSRTLGLSTSYRKDRKSDNFFTQTFFERPSLEYGYNRYDALGPKRSDSTRKYTTRLQYDLSPYKNRSYRPLEFTRNWVLIPRFIRDFEFTPYPDQMRLVVFDLAFNRSNQTNRSDLNQDINKEEALYNVDLAHEFQFNWRTFNFLTFNYGVKVGRDLDDYHESFASDQLFSFNSEQGFLASDLVFNGMERQVFQNGSSKTVTYGMLMAENTRTQTFDVDFSPQFFNWLPFNTRASTSYSHNIQELSQSRNNSGTNIPEHFKSSLNHNLSFNPSLQLSSIFGNLDAQGKSFFAKSLVAVRDRLEKWRFSSITGSYSIGHRFEGEEFDFQGLSDRGISSTELLAYQLGFLYAPQSFFIPERLWDEVIMGRNFDNGDLDAFDVYSPPLFAQSITPLSHGINQEARTSTGFTVPGLDLAINPSLKWSQSFVVRRDTVTPYSDTTRTWPEVFVSGNFSDLTRKIPWLENHFSQFGLSSAYDFKITRKFGVLSQDEQSRSITHSLQPLLKISMTTKKNHHWDADFNLAWGSRESKIKDTSGRAEVRTYKSFTDTVPLWKPRAQGRDYKEDENIAASVKLGWNYDLQASRGIPLGRFFIKLENSLRLKMTGESAYLRNRTFTYKPIGLSESQLTKETTKHTLVNTIQPELNYTFTRKVDALAWIRVVYSKEYQTNEEESQFSFLLRGEITMRF